MKLKYLLVWFKDGELNHAQYSHAHAAAEDVITNEIRIFQLFEDKQPWQEFRFMSFADYVEHVEKFFGCFAHEVSGYIDDI